MKRLLAGMAFLIAGGFGAQSAPDGVSLSFSGGSCARDEEIAQASRQAIEAGAMAYVRALLDGKPDAAFQLMIREARGNAASLEVSTELSDIIHRTGPYSDAKVVHTYLLETVGSGPDTTAICGPIGGTDWVAVGVKSGATQAHVVISAKTRNNDWAFTLWLMREGDAWRVRYVHMDASTIVGHTPDDLLKLAREQRDQGHTLNAQMLYVATQFTSNRGSAFQLGIVQALRGDLEKFKRAPELEGKPPFSWTMNGAVYKVSSVNIIGVGGELGLTFELPLAQWKDDKDADKRNHAFLDAFRAAHPEYSQSFGFLVARALKPDGSGGFATVYDAKKGYV